MRIVLKATFQNQSCEQSLSILKSIIKNKSLEAHWRAMDGHFQSNDEVSAFSYAIWSN